MNEWLDSLEPRERLTLLAGAVILGLTLIWVIVISPLYSSASDRATRASDLQRDIGKARELRSQIQAAGNMGSVPQTDQSLMITVERSAREFGLQVDRSRPMDASTVRVNFESAPFDSLVLWIGVLQSRHGLLIDIASLDRRDAPGMVDAQLTVRRPG